VKTDMVERRWLAVYRRCDIAVSNLECKYNTATERGQGYSGLRVLNWHPWSSWVLLYSACTAT
jgi:hypothetical protein